MRLPKFSLDGALDSWSDFAIECWTFAVRLALVLIGLFYLWGLTGRWTADLFERLGAHWLAVAIAIFAGGVILAVMYRIERAFSRQKKKRALQLSGGRNASTRKPKRRQWGGRKRKRKP